MVQHIFDGSAPLSRPSFWAARQPMQALRPALSGPSAVSVTAAVIGCQCDSLTPSEQIDAQYIQVQQQQQQRMTRGPAARRYGRAVTHIKSWLHDMHADKYLGNFEAAELATLEDIGAMDIGCARLRTNHRRTRTQPEV
jgi:hypothetical protein